MVRAIVEFPTISLNISQTGRQSVYYVCYLLPFMYIKSRSFVNFGYAANVYLFTISCVGKQKMGNFLNKFVN